MSVKIKKKILSLVGASSLLLPLVVVAQVVVVAQGIDPALDRIRGTINNIIAILFVLATLIFLWGVVQFIAGAGDPGKRDKAKGIMWWGIVGLAVMAAAWGVANVLISYFIPGGGTPPNFVPPPLTPLAPIGP